MWPLPRALQSLDCSENALRELNACFDSLTALVPLDVSYNKLTSIAGLAQLQVLRVLKAKYNKISSLEGVVTLTSLETLDVEGNFVRSAEDLALLDANPALREVCLMYNPIQE